ncbi:hypothetical protein SARC_01946 [Sphaeroforma arctica JP610]|uniref:Alginate lyase domain-containing protein n=1 Tax=Sphaeroforma arctica JP610 TaxID=667725 RepID=A0A0L0GCB9_9EUKA|nr:hypothetical protein SARC_01946 [Sphaeroforma arctica JP610]KNC85908.1 hypothetical protein SARC_01946 [Sphaeroforma arctica JP610]|eukprot:XP_014159810.1 hypothetical protein SARC_01946 [Sphaeroforma arctica JP610]
MSHPPTLNKRLILVVLLSLLGHATAADTSAEECELADPTLYLWDAKQLSNLKKKYQSGDASSVFKSSLSFLERECAEALDGETYSVTYQKRVPESGDIHDYQSVGYYWWPCAEAEHEGFNNCVQKTKTGTEPKECVDDAKWGSIPWRYCDGHHNAATFEYSSKESMQQMTNQVRDLALLWYYTEKDQYARIASQLLQVFFLDEDTRMNPMLQYAQFVPDLWYFESAGLIEITGWTELLEAVAILRTSQHWSNAHHRQLMDWMYELMEWLQTSRMGEKEHYAGNNHAVWYYQTVIGMGLHVTEIFSFHGYPAMTHERLSDNTHTRAHLFVCCAERKLGFSS